MMRVIAAGIAAVSALVSAPAAVAAGDQPHQYVGASKCKTCHGKELMGDQYAAWLKDPHHRAYQTLKEERSIAIARERGLLGAPHEAPECLRCHVTAFGAPPVEITTTLDPAEGVQCESCHGPGRDYRKKSIMSDRERAATKGLWDAGRDEALCTTCHNSESPTFDPRRYVNGDGKALGFDFERAKQRIRHPIPEQVKGRYVELEKEQKEAERAGRQD